MALPAALCLVVGITDGDSIKVRCGTEGNYEVVKIRISAIDAPEKNKPMGKNPKKRWATFVKKKWQRSRL